MEGELPRSTCDCAAGEPRADKGERKGWRPFVACAGSPRRLAAPTAGERGAEKWGYVHERRSGAQEYPTCHTRNGNDVLLRRAERPRA
eukprot:scaffold57809_cov33-Tisochrysis_lutea.AAC.1